MPTNNSKSLKYMLLSGIGLAGLSLIYWGYTQYQLAMRYCYKLRDVKVLSLSYSEIKIRIMLAIRNYSNIGASISSVNVKVFVNGIFLTEIKSDKQQKLDADGVSILNIDASVFPKKMLSGSISDFTNAVLALSDKDKTKTKIKLDGVVGISVGFIKLNAIKISTEMTLAEMTAEDPNAFVCDIK